MKKIAILAGVAGLMAASAAEARVNLDFNFGVPAYPSYVAQPVYVQPAPSYVAVQEYPAYYHHRHWHHDRGRRR